MTDPQTMTTEDAPGEPLEQQVSNEHIRLPCLVLLDKHFALGGLSRKGYDMLQKMVEFMSAIGWETHLIFQSKIASARCVDRIEKSIGYILEGCSVFQAHMQKAVDRVDDAAACLPLLDQKDVTLKTKLTQWLWKLKTLHEPTGRDRRVFIAIFRHYKEMFDRLAELNRRKPKYQLERTVDKAIDLLGALEGLIHVARAADDGVKALHDEFKTAVKLLMEREDTKASEPPSRVSSDTLMASKYRPQTKRTQTKMSSALSKSFGIVEEDIARRRHGRASTLMAPSYTVESENNAQAIASSGSFDTIIRRPRRGSSTPRIFTGSLTELEDSVQMLQLHKVRTPESVEDTGNVIATPTNGLTLTARDSRGSSPPPPLQRREAVVSKETELQDRVIKGEIISSRRPSNKEKTQPDLEALSKPDVSKLSDGCKDNSGEQKSDHNTSPARACDRPS